jgi:hypothetical protein
VVRLHTRVLHTNVARFQQEATAAATTLLKVMLDQTTPASVKVRAAECVMNHSSTWLACGWRKIPVFRLKNLHRWCTMIMTGRLREHLRGQEAEKQL